MLDVPHMGVPICEHALISTYPVHYNGYATLENPAPLHRVRGGNLVLQRASLAYGWTLSKEPV